MCARSPTLAERSANIPPVQEGDHLPEDWFHPEPDAAETPIPPAWRRWLIIGMASLALIGLAGTQVWNLVFGGSPPIAENGLEVCGFDYCEVQDAIRAAGLDLEMARLAQTFVDDETALALVETLIAELGEPPVAVEIVNRIEGSVAGDYSPATRTIRLERPLRAWIVVHEVAHTVAPGHGEQFVATLERLVPLAGDL